MAHRLENMETFTKKHLGQREIGKTVEETENKPMARLVGLPINNTKNKPMARLVGLPIDNRSNLANIGSYVANI